MATKLNEVVHLRILRFPCCQNQVCWINKRLPNHCPECGTSVYIDIKFHSENTLASDENAVLLYSIARGIVI